MEKILVVDDERNVRGAFEDILATQGYDVLAGGGLEALQAFSRETPDLVILDICMPRVNGLETLERLKAIAPEVPVILFTAHDEDCLRDHRGDLAAACVEKSADLSELTWTIDRVFRAISSGGRSPPSRFGLPQAASVACALDVASPLGGRL